MADGTDMEEWMVSSNEALSISLVAPTKSGLQNITTFSPRFTYSIFGEDEQIFGYKGLKISLRYRANDMRPHLKISSAKKIKPYGDSEADDVLAILTEGNYLPKIAYSRESDFEESSKQVVDDFTPPGELHDTFDGPDGHYEVWKGSLADPAVKQLNTRVQMLVPLFIEGGTYIGQNDEPESTVDETSDADRWTLFSLYRKDESGYVFVGYSTVYRFYWFQNPTPPASPRDGWELPEGSLDLAELPCRKRLSQFIILPPFQGKGHGAQLYKTIFAHYHKQPQTQEFTVEDPNEAFDDLRDICDLEFLNSMPEFRALKLDTSVELPEEGPLPDLIVGQKNLENIRQKAKIAPRQFYRAVEMYLMSQLPASVRPTMDLEADIPSPTKEDKHQELLWQLVAKQRLYRHNKDALSQMEVDERKEKLAEVLIGVELGNARILAAYEKAMERSKGAADGKRKLEGAEQSASKKPKT
ncbi:histone acetyltransferase 1 [Emericellopsis cladophorae]|uniref:Histone acetyltransferase type B catalytic subunit n=1 Tax=Emericellopsis cladophorae TaxID=2686198 RepID=A0A9P9Y0G5_9HYPO|nr:histone acetyltransferase 1 [Emericellopsis cladophorae]KAI6781075.1 histone acetyltransferase 1 [Emericellopsis cladophorae]